MKDFCSQFGSFQEYQQHGLGFLFNQRRTCTQWSIFLSDFRKGLAIRVQTATGGRRERDTLPFCQCCTDYKKRSKRENTRIGMQITKLPAHLAQKLGYCLEKKISDGNDRKWNDIKIVRRIRWRGTDCRRWKRLAQALGPDYGRTKYSVDIVYDGGRRIGIMRWADSMMWSCWISNCSRKKMVLLLSMSCAKQDLFTSSDADSARWELTIRWRDLTAGADDYMTKTFSPEELQRVSASTFPRQGEMFSWKTLLGEILPLKLSSAPCTAVLKSIGQPGF